MSDHLPRLITELPGPRARSLIARDHAVLSPSYTRPYPFVMARGQGAVVEDVDGNRFLDCTAGIAVLATGHANPRVLKAIEEQAARFLHMSGTDFYYENAVKFAEKLVELMPATGPRRVYFGNSGTEAIEAAMKLARYYTGRQQFISFFGSFHGRTMGALSLTASKNVQKKNFFPLVPGVHHVPYPNCYRCPYGTTPDRCAVECVRHIDDVMRHVLPPTEIAAIVVEPVQGEGGYVVAPQKFMDELQGLARKHGILLIFDEVQSGMGRTGKMLAAEHFHADPDIVTLAKGIASGLRLSATIARSEIMSWTPGSHASTFGGNPVSIAAALVTIELLEEGLIANAASVGVRMMARMREWPNRYQIVGDVRGLGLMIGIELVSDQHAKEPAPALRDTLEQMAFQRGLLIIDCAQNCIRLCPPLTISAEQADWAVDTLEECLTLLAANCASSTSAAV